MINSISIESTDKISDTLLKDIFGMFKSDNYAITVNGEIVEAYKYIFNDNDRYEITEPLFKKNNYLFHEFLNLLKENYYIIFGKIFIKDVQHRVLMVIEIVDTTYYQVKLYDNSLSYIIDKIRK